MALRVAARRSSVLRNSSYGLRVFERKLNRRDASAMAVPVSSQEEMTGNDIAVSKTLKLRCGFRDTHDIIERDVTAESRPAERLPNRCNHWRACSIHGSNLRPTAAHDGERRRMLPVGRRE